ncbi:MAG: lamin tail domain-containing protein [Bacteroidales bacterium]|nr:lamin tail domain-containing protein [Candidatus Cryptobacteroides caccocaballi]
MNKKIIFSAILASAVAIPAAIFATIATAGENQAVPARPEGPCDVYAQAGNPCVTAHSSTRALYASYSGPLYQVMRESDRQTLDIGVVQPSAGDAGGYANAAAQDEFCANTTCWITCIYDQSGKENHLYQAPRGAFVGAALGGFDTLPIADMAPVTLGGHKVYGVYIVPGMGLRQNDTHGIAVDDQAEGQYWVINGLHYNSGCCFDYGNAETDSRDDGDGTMETTYYGNQPLWYHGEAPGPWIMTDQENNLVGCVNPDPNDKLCKGLPSITWRFVTAMADGEPMHWRSMGGDAQGGELITMFDGPRIQNPRHSYDIMRKQGAVLLGNGGDNNNYSSGTFYEGAMTAPGTFPTIATNQAIQANVVAARYDVQRLYIGASDKSAQPNLLQTFTPNSTGYTTVKFVNTTGETLDDLSLSIVTPKGWKAVVKGTGETVKKIDYDVLPGQSVVVNFVVTSGSKTFNGDLVAKADWSVAGKKWSETAVEKVRNVAPVRINEFRVEDGVNRTNSFIELYNSSDNTVDISGWELIPHEATLPYFNTIKINAGTKLAPKDYYLLGLSTSGLAVPAAKGDKVLYVRSTEGMKVGDEITIGTGANAEKRIIASIKNPDDKNAVTPRIYGRVVNEMGHPTTIWQPLPEGPVIKIPAGSKSVPVESLTGVKVGDKLAIGYGAQFPVPTAQKSQYEVVTVTKVGKPGVQAWLAYDAKKGERNIKVSSVEEISVGDVIRLDIDSEGHGVEYVKVKKVGTASTQNPGRGPMSLEEAGTGLTLEKPLKYNHSANMPFNTRGTGISFEPATKFDHFSNEPVLALCYEIALTEGLSNAHEIEDVILDASVKTAGYQGDVEPDQYFGGPALARLGNMTLYDADHNVVDCINWGTVVNPMLAEGYQGQSGLEEYGNFIHLDVPNYTAQQRFVNPNAPTMSHHNLSAGRFPDGRDSDDNMLDFKFQLSINLLKDAAAGSKTVVVTDTDALRIGHIFHVGYGDNLETVTVGTIGEPQTEVTTVQMGEWTREMKTVYRTLTLTTPLKNAHKAGASLVDNVPTPGAPNQF